MSIAQMVVQCPEQVETSSTELLSSQVWSPSLVVNRPLRLRLSPSIGQGALDGAWWPFSRDLTAEALDLVDHFPASVDRIRRVVYSTPDWDAAPPRIKAAEVFVSLASFPRDDTHRVLLKSVAAYNPRVLQLLFRQLSFDLCELVVSQVDVRGGQVSWRHHVLGTID